jgi:phage baseplate assembly protein W
VSTELQVPFSLDSNGNLAVTTDPNVQAAQHVKSIVATNPGERVMMPDYGIPVRGYLFSSAYQLVELKIQQNVKTQMARWEPRITVLGVTSPNADQYGVAQVDVSYTSNPLETGGTQTATVLIGGDVVEQSQYATVLPGGDVIETTETMTTYPSGLTTDNTQEIIA